MHQPLIEAALAHVVRNRTEAAYARSDLFARRRHLMDDWAEYLWNSDQPEALPRHRMPHRSPKREPDEAT